MPESPTSNTSESPDDLPRRKLSLRRNKSSDPSEPSEGPSGSGPHPSPPEDDSPSGQESGSSLSPDDFEDFEDFDIADDPLLSPYAPDDEPEPSDEDGETEDEDPADEPSSRQALEDEDLSPDEPELGSENQTESESDFEDAGDLFGDLLAEVDSAIGDTPGSPSEDDPWNMPMDFGEEDDSDISENDFMTAEITQDEFGRDPDESDDDRDAEPVSEDDTEDEELEAPTPFPGAYSQPPAEKPKSSASEFVFNESGEMGTFPRDHDADEDPPDSPAAAASAESGSSVIPPGAIDIEGLLDSVDEELPPEEPKPAKRKLRVKRRPADSSEEKPPPPPPGKAPRASDEVVFSSSEEELFRPPPPAGGEGDPDGLPPPVPEDFESFFADEPAQPQPPRREQESTAFSDQDFDADQPETPPSDQKSDGPRKGPPPIDAPVLDRPILPEKTGLKLKGKALDEMEDEEAEAGSKGSVASLGPAVRPKIQTRPAAREKKRGGLLIWVALLALVAGGAGFYLYGPDLSSLIPGSSDADTAFTPSRHADSANRADADSEGPRSLYGRAVENAQNVVNQANVASDTSGILGGNSSGANASTPPSRTPPVETPRPQPVIETTVTRRIESPSTIETSPLIETGEEDIELEFEMEVTVDRDAVKRFISGLNVSGVIGSGRSSRTMINGVLYDYGKEIAPEHGLIFAGTEDDPKRLIFEDRDGFLYYRKF